MRITDDEQAIERIYEVAFLPEMWPDFWTFRMLFDTGEEGPVMCPQNLAKDARAPNSW